ncbi:hypothetical protein ACMGDK_01940 [Chryseobacterium sp. DT-3]|uniref:hypothetical protein n=1 Tax=Chryseobacterium sp. DT-3 TaxID=3396164 RepID=UPI003F1C950E
MNDTDRKNIDLYLSYKLLFLTTPVLYGFILWKIFELYDFSLTIQLILFLLPIMTGLFIKLKSKDIPNNTQHILLTMSFYSIPFFLAVNASFDFSKPSSKAYIITDKASAVEKKYDSEGPYEVTNYEFKIIPKEKDISSTEHSKPVATNVNRKTYHQFEKGDYLDIETYPGLLGIKWTYYHWKFNN